MLETTSRCHTATVVLIFVHVFVIVFVIHIFTTIPMTFSDILWHSTWLLKSTASLGLDFTKGGGKDGHCPSVFNISAIPTYHCTDTPTSTPLFYITPVLNNHIIRRNFSHCSKITGTHSTHFLATYIDHLAPLGTTWTTLGNTWKPRGQDLEITWVPHGNKA